MKRLLPWIPALVWAALLFALSSRPALPGPGVPHLDKAAHFGVYAVLGAFLAFAAARTGWPLRSAALLGILYGASDEVHQLFVPGRSASVLDWVADAAGVLAAVYLYARRRERRAGVRRAGPRTTDTSVLSA